MTCPQCDKAQAEADRLRAINTEHTEENVVLHGRVTALGKLIEERDAGMRQLRTALAELQRYSLDDGLAEQNARGDLVRWADVAEAFRGG